jgi:hypothetical protein
LIEERLDDFALRALHIITERVGPRELVTADVLAPSVHHVEVRFLGESELDVSVSALATSILSRSITHFAELDVDPFHPSARATDRDAGISVRCCVEREPERDVFSLQYLGVSAC